MTCVKKGDDDMSMNNELLKDSIKRFCWALNVNRTVNRKKYSDLVKVCSKYSRCFIVGTGPSLTKEDLHKLDNECLFVSNRFVMYGDEFHPVAYFCQDSTVLENLLGDINNYQSAKYKLLNSYILRLNNRINKSANTIFYNVNRKRYIKGMPPTFSEKLLDYADGYTVTYSMIQAAVALGFKEIYLLGIDFNYQMSADGKVDDNLSYSKELNTKFKVGSPNMDYNLQAYMEAQRYCTNKGISIFNATRGGKLEVFDRVNLDDVVKGEL